MNSRALIYSHAQRASWHCVYARLRRRRVDFVDLLQPKAEFRLVKSGLFLSISRFLEGILMEHIESKVSLESHLLTQSHVLSEIFLEIWYQLKK